MLYAIDAEYYYNPFSSKYLGNQNNNPYTVDFKAEYANNIKI